MKHKNTKI